MSVSESHSDSVPRAGASMAWPLSRSTTISILSVVVFLLLWQVAPTLGLVNGRYTSQPTLVAQAFVDVLRDDNFFHHARISLAEFAIGFALALVVSIPLGTLLGTSRIARDLIDPPLMALYIAPNLILLPILIIWLGIGAPSKVAIVFLGAIFPIVINTMAGMREADPRLIRMARSFGATKLQRFVRILVPASLPSILIGVRLAVGRGVLGVVVGELYVSQAGVGHQLMTYGSSMRVDRLLVYAIVVSVFGYALTVFVRSLESMVQNWKSE